MPILENGTDLWILKARLSFPNIVKPKAFEGGEPKYSAAFIIDENDDDYKTFLQRASKLAQERWGENAAGVMGNIKMDKRLRCYGKGTEKTDKVGKIYAGYDVPGAVYLSASSSEQPQMIGANAQPAPPTSVNQMFVGGNLVSAIIRPWIQNNQFGNAIRAELVAVQYLSEGEHFGTTNVDATGVFKAVEGAPAPAAGGDAPFDMLS